MSKRILAIVLALSLVASFFAFQVFAYDDVPAVTLQMPGGAGTPGVIDGVVPWTYGVPANGSVTQYLRNLYVVRPKHNTYVSFCIRFTARNYDLTYLPDISYVVDGLVNNDEWVVVHRQFYERFTFYYDAVAGGDGPTYYPVTHERKCYYYCLKYIGDDASGVKTLNLNTTVTLSNRNSYTVIMQPEFFNVSVTTDISDVIDNILNVENQIQVNTANTAVHLNRLNSFLFYDNSFDYTTISYDADGNATTSTAKTSWYKALLYNMQAMIAPIKQQVEQQQRAKDAGAEDALDLAYDSVGDSFGSLGDFSGLGSLGSFNGDALGSSGTNGLLTWFSQENADAIDSVPKDRAPGHVIDFYSEKIVKYLEEVNSDDSTAVGGD